MPSGAPALTLAFSGAKQKPVLDETFFQQLLAAAYVVQQHNDSLWTKLPQLDTARLLAELSDMQAQASKVELPVAAKLITERLLNMIAATGVSLSLIKDGYLDCLAESGVPAKVPGSSIASHSLVATERLKSGDVFESGDSRHDIRLDAELCNGFAVGSLIAAPVFRLGQLAGLIEVRWARPHAFEETGVFACRLMTSLVTGILERGPSPGVVVQLETAKVVASSDSAEKVTEAATEASANETPIEAKSAAAEQLTVTESKEAVGKNSAASASAQERALIEPTDSEDDRRAAEISPRAVAETSPDDSAATAVPSNCRICGQPLRAHETFCGHCSMPRAAATANENLQSKWASLWFIHQAKGAPGVSETESENEAPQAAAASQIANTAEAAGSMIQAEIQPDPPLLADSLAHSNDQFSYFEPVTLEHDAASEIKFWERAAAAASISKSALRKLRAKDITLIIVASVLAVGVISAWPSNGRLTWFGSMMVRMGLARHSVPAFAGNPAVNVWVDEQTSLYYCPGEDRYGTTSAGHFSTQLEAEQSQLHPGSGLVCQ